MLLFVYSFQIINKYIYIPNYSLWGPLTFLIYIFTIFIMLWWQRCWQCYVPCSPSLCAGSFLFHVCFQLTHLSPVRAAQTNLESNNIYILSPSPTPHWTITLCRIQSHLFSPQLLSGFRLKINNFMFMRVRACICRPPAVHRGTAIDNLFILHIFAV